MGLSTKPPRSSRSSRRGKVLHTAVVGIQWYGDSNTYAMRWSRTEGIVPLASLVYHQTYKMQRLKFCQSWLCFAGWNEGRWLLRTASEFTSFYVIENYCHKPVISQNFRHGDSAKSTALLFRLTVSGVRRKFSWGCFIQWHMVVTCVWSTLLVTSQFDVIFIFPKQQRFGEVCWHNMHIRLHPLPLIYV